MKTKIVYVVVSSLNDVYWEQAWASAWTARFHNPNAHIALVCDKDTYNFSIDCYRNKSLSLFDEVVSIPFDASVSNIQRSRHIKTNLRKHIKGDFLFVDSDTVITSDLCEVDDFDFNMGMVCDMHTHPCPIPEFYGWVNMAYGYDMLPDTKWFNSGVIYAKDNVETSKFFECWHHNWQLAGGIVGYTDQTPLAKTVKENENFIHDIPGIYNCQVCSSVMYLCDAKILHFFNHSWFIPTIIHPLMLKETYLKIKDNEGISDDMISLLLNCKSSFYPVSAPIGIDEGNFLRTYLIHDFMYPLYKKKLNIYTMFSKGVYFLMKIRGKLKMF